MLYKCVYSEVTSYHACMHVLIHRFLFFFFPVFQLCPSCHTISRFNSWVAGAKVSFLLKETQQQTGIDPGQPCDYQADPRPFSYYTALVSSPRPIPRIHRCVT